MKIPEEIKQEKISHLEYCLEKLLQKDNGYNELEIKRLYSLIYAVIDKMTELPTDEALCYFTDNINDDIRKSLGFFNITLSV